MAMTSRGLVSASVLFCAGLLALLPCTAWTATITYNFSGSLHAAFIPGNTLKTGDLFNGSFSYETTTPRDPNYPTNALAIFPGAVTSLQIDFANYSLLATGGYVEMRDNSSSDQIFFRMQGAGLVGALPGGLQPLEAYFRITYPSANPISIGPTLPSVLDMSLPKDIAIYFGSLGLNYAFGTVTSASLASVSEVPIPAALPLFATILAAGGLLAWRRKRKNAAALAAA
jgi:hypothetical protein